VRERARARAREREREREKEREREREREKEREKERETDRETKYQAQRFYDTSLRSPRIPLCIKAGKKTGTKIALKDSVRKIKRKNSVLTTQVHEALVYHSALRLY
jgi:hypothetical protein